MGKKEQGKESGRSEIWSFFSGAMGLDLGLEAAGLHPTLAVEKDKWCCKTIRLNRPDLDLIEGDVSLLKGKELMTRRGCKSVFLMVGGPPCQSFSPGGNRSGISDPRGNLIYEYMRLIDEVRPDYFVLENVGNLITAALRHRPIKDRPGKNWNLRAYSYQTDAEKNVPNAMEPDEMSGSAVRQILKDFRSIKYNLSFKVVDAADYGAAQHRFRFILMGAKKGVAPNLPEPTHGDVERSLLPHVTLRDVIYDLREKPGPHSEYSIGMRTWYDMVPAGGYWKDLPKELHEKALGTSYTSGGGKTGFYRRLSYDAPSPTLTTKSNRKGTGMCHPEYTRPISVKEAARIQGFPDDWNLAGAMNEQYKQIGNAVPTILGAVIGNTITQFVVDAPKARGAKLNSDDDFERMFQIASIRLRSAARNKKVRKPKPLANTLFDV